MLVKNCTRTCDLQIIFDDLLLYGIPPVVENVIQLIDLPFKLVTIVKVVGRLRFFGRKKVQHADCLIETNSDDTLIILETRSLSRLRSKR